jgi:hypothetical protein
MKDWAWIRIYKDFHTPSVYSYLFPTILEYIDINEIDMILISKKEDWQYALVHLSTTKRWGLFVFNPKRLYDSYLDVSPQWIQQNTIYGNKTAEMFAMIMEMMS